MRILIVEDSELQTLIVRSAMERRGLEVACARSLEEAFETLSKRGIDAILLDLSLPGSSGLETLARVRNEAFDIPIVILTSLDDQEVALEALKSGAQDYLIKGQARDEVVFRCLRYSVERSKVEAALKRSEKRLRIILDQSYDAFISMNADWRIRDWNAQAEKTFGWSRSEVLGKGLSVIVPPHLRKQYAKGVVDFFSNNPSKVLRKSNEVMGIHKDGHEFPIEIGIFRVSEDVAHMYCAFARDISKRKQAAEELEMQVQKRTAELMLSNEELRQFAKIASHDLQEPLRAIQGFSTLLAESARGKLDKDCDEFIDYILDGTKRMQQLIESVLVHSSVKEEKPGDISTNCDSVIEEVLGNLDISIKETEAHFQVDDLPEVAVDRWQLIQLFQNLISNAIKYRSDEAPKVHISAERTVNEWLFSVRDNGIGIDPQYQDKIFDMFARLHGKVRYSGTGMGLAICKKIVTLHGGKIWVESKLEEGSIFLFTLPAAEKPERRPAMDSKIRILLAEDSPSDVRLTEEALKRSELKYEMSVVMDGVETMEYLNKLTKSNTESLPDIILLDLNMPKKNGHEVLSEIKDDPLLKKIPVVLLTVSQRDEDVMEALKLKMNYYLAKPITAQKLSVLLKSIYELHSEESEGSEHHSDEETHVRLVLAGNPHTSAIILKKLATDENARVRCRVAENEQTPQDALLQLADDGDPEVRLSVSENPAAPLSLIEKLAEDPSEDVRLGLASNPRTPAGLLSQLANDQNTFVAASANKTLSNLTPR